MNNVIPERLKQARIQAGLSVGQVVKLGNYMRKTILDFEDGSLQPTLGDLLQLGYMYGVTHAWLRGEEKPLELTPEHLEQLAKLPPEDRDRIIDFLTSLRG